MTSELDKEWDEIQKFAKAKSLGIFPAMLVSEKLESIISPDEISLEGFLNLAQQLGIHLIYAQTSTLDQEIIEDFESRLDNLENEQTSEGSKLISVARSHTGDIFQISVQWIYEGIIHEYLKHAEWFSDLEATIEELNPSEDLDDEDLDGSEMSEVEREERAKEFAEISISREKKIEELAERLAQDKNFQRAASWDAQNKICVQLFPELKNSSDENDIPPAYEVVRRAKMISNAGVRGKREEKLKELAEKLAQDQNFQKAASWDAQKYLCEQIFSDLENSSQDNDIPSISSILNRARIIYKMEILPGQEKEITRKAYQMLASGSSMVATARHLGMSEKKLQRLLALHRDESR